MHSLILLLVIILLVVRNKLGSLGIDFLLSVFFMNNSLLNNHLSNDRMKFIALIFANIS